MAKNDKILVILAGGESRRFQTTAKSWQDKAKTVNAEGIPFIVEIIKKAELSYKEICVSINSEKRKEEYKKLMKEYSVKIPKFVVDNSSILVEGVLKGIITAYEYYNKKHQPIQFISCDRPLMCLSLLKKIEITDSAIGLLKHSNGMIEPLLAIYETNLYFPDKFKTLPVARADLLPRINPKLEFFDIDKLLTENNLSFEILQNINNPTDLKETLEECNETHKKWKIPQSKVLLRKKIREEPEFTTLDETENFIEYLFENKHFYSAYLWSNIVENKFSSDNFEKYKIQALEEEYEYWIDNDNPFFALHALQDLIRNFPKEKTLETEKTIIDLKQKMGIKAKNSKNFKTM